MCDGEFLFAFPPEIQPLSSRLGNVVLWQFESKRNPKVYHVIYSRQVERVRKWHIVFMTIGDGNPELS